MRSILVTDLHLTNRPKDEYRWSLLPWLRKQAKKHEAEYVFILGDITDAKDRHPGTLINRIGKGIESLANAGLKVGINLGNHDYIDPSNPTFRFLGSHKSGNIRYYTEPTFDDTFSPLPTYWMPHQHERVFVLPENAAEGFAKAKLVFLHQTFNKARAETGQLMEGIDLEVLPKTKAKIYSGDIHVPQTLGPVTYVGAPYVIRFGDTFKPRCVLLEGNKHIQDLHYPTIKKVVVEIDDMTDLSGLDSLSEKDQVKVRVNVKRSEIHDWQTHRAAILSLGVTKGLDMTVEMLAPESTKSIKQKGENKINTNKALFNMYCKKNKVLPETKQLGETILKSEL